MPSRNIDEIFTQECLASQKINTSEKYPFTSNIVVPQKDLQSVQMFTIKMTLIKPKMSFQFVYISLIKKFDIQNCYTMKTNKETLFLNKIKKRCFCDKKL